MKIKYYLIFAFLFTTIKVYSFSRNIDYYLNGIISEPEVKSNHISRLKSIPIIIEKENLLIDAKKLKFANEIVINSTYNLKSLKTIHNCRLVFYSFVPFRMKNFTLTLDKEKIKLRTINKVSNFNLYPVNFIFKYAAKKNSRIRSQVYRSQIILNRITKGRHVLTISYRTKANENVHHEKLIKEWEVLYLLKYAYKFKTFNNLNIKVLTPAGWKFTSNIKLNNKPGVFYADIKKPSKPFISIQLRTNISGVFYRVLYYGISVVIFFGIFIMAVWGIESRKKILFYSFIFSVVASVLSLILYIGELDVLKQILSNQINTNYGSGGWRILSIFYFPFILLVAFITIVMFNFIFFEIILKKLWKKI